MIESIRNRTGDSVTHVCMIGGNRLSALQTITTMSVGITRDLPVLSDAGTVVLSGPLNPMDGTGGIAVLLVHSTPQTEAFLDPVAAPALAGDSPHIYYRWHGRNLRTKRAAPI